MKMSTIILKKDRKLICRTICRDPPAELPHNWSIDIAPSKKICSSGLPQFTIHPDPESTRDKEEWGRFLGYLHKRDMVAFAEFEQYKFYILPPAEVSTSSPVRVAYWMDKACMLGNCPRDCESASHMAEEHGQPDNRIEDHACHSTAETCSKPQTHVPKQHKISEKNYIRVDSSYLKTLGHVHSGWIFGGIAELVDNSWDAKATKINIFIDMIKFKKTGKDVPILSIIDDGHGMNHDEVMKMVSFGHKQLDGDDPGRIGKFGVGFKTGAMRLGRDALVLTQTANSRSIAFLSQSLNEGKDNIEIPVVSYCRQGQYMEVDTSVQSEALAKYNLQAIQKFSPFNKYLIGEKLALFSDGTGTQIYIWNLDEWGSNYCLQWHDGLKGGSSFHQGDIFIRSRRTRSRPGQVSQKVPLDYSLRSYLEVIFLVPRMKISVQHSLVKSRPLANFLTKTVVKTGDILGKHVQLTLGFSQLEWEQANCGIFLYWHGRLIEAYKRVGGMIHSADVGRGVIGVIDVTGLMNDGNGRVWVHNNKQGFQDCEAYAYLEQWLGRRVDEYWDSNFDSLKLDVDKCIHKPDHEWVQCDKCRKWRMLPSDFNSRNLPTQWFCYMKPFNGQCDIAEEKMKPGMVIISTKRSGYDSMQKDSHCKESKNTVDTMNVSNKSDDNLTSSEDNRSPPLEKRRIDDNLTNPEDKRSPPVKKGRIDDNLINPKDNRSPPLKKRRRLYRSTAGEAISTS